MSAFNWFQTEKRAYEMRTVNWTADEAALTAKTGRTADNFIIDRVIRVTTTSGGENKTITVPDGEYYGQRLLVILEVLGDDETLNVTCSTGDSGTQMTGAGGYSDLCWMGSTLGWVELSNEAT